MVEKNLRLVKSGKNAGQRRPRPAMNRPTLVVPPAVPVTPAEADEAARFKAYVMARAARQVMLRQIMAELEALDDGFPAA